MSSQQTGDRKRGSDDKCSSNCPSLSPPYDLEKDEEDGIRSLQSTSSTYYLCKHLYEDFPEFHNTMPPRPVPNLDDFILGTELSLTSPTVVTQI